MFDYDFLTEKGKLIMPLPAIKKGINFEVIIALNGIPIGL